MGVLEIWYLILLWDQTPRTLRKKHCKGTSQNLAKQQCQADTCPARLRSQRLHLHPPYPPNVFIMQIRQAKS